MTTAEPSAISGASGTIDWDDLLTSIDDGRVVPILGRDLLTLPHEGAGEPPLFYRELAVRLAQSLKVPQAALPEELDLEDVASLFLEHHRDEWDTLYSRLRILLRDFRPEVPTALRRLAEIEPLKLFVSTTFDDLLTRALSDERSGVKLEERQYRPRDTPQDLPAELEDEVVRVFYLLGRPPGEAGSYAVTEEDTLEFVLDLQAKLHPTQGELRNLGRALQQRHLLFLGCGFPDWLMRFFIRTLRGERFHTERPSKRARVAERRTIHERPLVLFLQQYGTRIYPGSPADFVTELGRRWAERTSAAAGSTVVPRADRTGAAPLVLLSGEESDRVASEPVGERLSQWGIGWTHLRFHVGDEIRTRAQLEACAAYVAFLSEKSVGGGPDADLLAEWKLVEGRARAADPALSTMVVTLDDAASKRHREQRNWGDWLRLALKLHRPSADDVALRIAARLLDCRRLQVPVPIRIYCAFADEDQDLREQFERHLGIAAPRAKWLVVWHRGRIAAGQDTGGWEEELDKASVIVLLVSVGLLADRATEVDRALERDRDRKARVVPILLKDCDWQGLLGSLYPLPTDQRPIDGRESPDGAWREVVQKLLLSTLDFVLGEPSTG